MVLLHSGSGSPSQTVFVSDETVSIISINAHVITDIAWQVQPPASYEYPAAFRPSLVVSQTLRSRPAGTTRGNYGYLFVKANYDDGSSEEVMASETTVLNLSPNVLFTAPDGVDSHTGAPALFMYNNGTQRYMVTISKTAVTECIETAVTASFTRCSTTVGSSSPVMYIKLPGVLGIAFNISADGGGGTHSNKKMT
eukprot:4951087-Prymnesium_polylepis.1